MAAVRTSPAQEQHHVIHPPHRRLPRNGKKSQGPVTPEGKARSAANATRHGLASPGRLADSVCLTIETREEFLHLHQASSTCTPPPTPANT